MKQSKSKYLKDSFNYLSSGVIPYVLVFITLPIYTRFLSPWDFGIIALFTMFGSLITGFISIGLRSATYRYYFKYEEEKETFKIVNTNNASFVILMFIVFGFLVWSFSELISSKIFSSRISAHLLNLSYLHGCLEYAFGYLTFLLLAQTRSREYSIIILAQGIINAVVSIYLLYAFSLTYMARIYAFLITKTILVLVSVYLTRKLFAFEFSAKLFKESIKYSLPQIPGSIIGLIESSFDKTMLTRFKGLTSVGFYNLGEKFAGIVKFLMDAIEKVWSPYFYKNAREDSIASREKIVRSYYDITCISMLLGLCIAYFSEEMVRILTTKDFYFTVYLVPVYVFYYLSGLLATMSVSQISHSEKTINLLPPAVVGVVLNVFLNIILIIKYGVLGAVIATAIAGLGTNLTLMYYGNKVYPLPINNKKLFGLYLLLLISILPVYVMVEVNIGFFAKIILKTALLLLFVFIGFKLNLVSYEYSKIIWNAVVDKVRGYSEQSSRKV